MTPERHARIQEIFDAAIDLPGLRRGAYLEQVCAGDVDLRSQVEGLIDAAERTTQTLIRGPEPDSVEQYAHHLLNDRYRMVRELGRGTFGIVYLAQDERLHHKPVVVKVLVGAWRRDEWFQKKFDDETKALARIDHPGVVGILDAGRTTSGTPFLVMQYVDGVTLRSLIGPSGMSCARVAGIVQQIGQALAAAHARGVLHRDLKPANIMIQSSSAGESVRLIDFGIATVREDGTERTAEPTRAAGSFAYMAPEQFAGQPTARSDIYALGVISYELLAGKVPGNHPGSAVNVQQIRQQRADVPEDAIGIIGKALSIEARDRFQSASFFGDELARALTVPVVDRPAEHPAKVRRVPTISARVWATAVALVLLAGAAAKFFSNRPFEQPASKQSTAKQSAAEIAINFSATPARLSAGQRASLNWVVTGASEVSIEGIGRVPDSGSWNVLPHQSTTYRLTATSGSETRTAMAEVSVEATTYLAAAPPPRKESAPSDVSKADVSAAKTAGPSPTIPASAPPPTNPPVTEGTTIWLGSLAPGDRLTISAGKASSGQLTHELPAGPLVLKDVVPPQIRVVENSVKALVLENQSPNTESRITIRWTRSKP